MLNRAEQQWPSGEVTEVAASICIEDFCGRDERGFPTTFSADYFPSEQLTYFTGDWSDCPPMPSRQEPTNKAVWTWARQHSAWFSAQSESSQT